MVMSQAAGASQIAYEGFGQSFPIYANDGTGFTGPWAQGSFNAFASRYTPNEDSLAAAYPVGIFRDQRRHPKLGCASKWTWNKVRQQPRGGSLFAVAPNRRLSCL
jgi:hypothetical protein